MNHHRTFTWSLIFAICFVSGAATAADQAESGRDAEVSRYLDDTTSAENPHTEAPHAHVDELNMRVFWKKGLHLETDDGEFKMRIGGRIMYDMNFTSADDNVRKDIGDNQVGLRRVRLFFSGTLGKKFGYKIQFDVATGEVKMNDVYISLLSVGSGDLVFGHYKQPFSLSDQTSSKYFTFMERGTSTLAFVPDRDAGITWFGSVADGRMITHFGTFFRTGGDARGSGSGGWGLVGRWGWAVVNNKPSATLFWVGASAAWQNLRLSSLGSQNTRYRAHPDSFPRNYIDTALVSAERELRYGLEIAFRRGSVHAQAEVYQVMLSGVNGGEGHTFSGFYAQIGWFITGEARHFNTKKGSWGRVVPRSNFRSNGRNGNGALEIAIRFNMTDLNDGNVRGGEIATITAGINWYWNAYARMMLNVQTSEIKDSSATGVTPAGEQGTVTSLMLRWQIEF